MFDKPEKRKSRSIPMMDYYEALQMEFLSYYIRYLTYDRVQDKEKYLDFCKKKKDSIEKISLRNNLPSLFNSEKFKEKYFNKFLNSTGLPNMSYRDKYQKVHIGYWDKKYFFKEGIIIFYRDSEWEVVENKCKFMDVDSKEFIEYDDFVKVKKKGKPIIKVLISEISRDIKSLLNFEIF